MPATAVVSGTTTMSINGQAVPKKISRGPATFFLLILFILQYSEALGCGKLLEIGGDSDQIRALPSQVGSATNNHVKKSPVESITILRYFITWCHQVQMQRASVRYGLRPCGDMAYGYLYRYNKQLVRAEFPQSFNRCSTSFASSASLRYSFAIQRAVIPK